MEPTCYGSFEDVSEDDPLSSMDLMLLPLDMVVQWRRCGITADYAASFLAYSFEEQERVMMILSTVLNELLENAVKFSANKHDLVRVSIRHFGQVIQIEATNRGRLEGVDGLKAMVERIHDAEDIEDLFVAQVEHSAANDRAASGLGFINLVKDYNARLGVRVAPAADGSCDVKVQVRLDVDDVLGEGSAT